MRSSIKVLPSASRFDEVLHFVEGSRFNHFPVVDENERYVGMVHFSDLRGMMYDPVVRELVTAHDLARQNTPLAAPEMTLQELLDVFHETDVGSLAVVDAAETRRVVGIVEQRDLLLALHKSQTS
jgi:CIC family chloride channel protein